MKLCKFSDSQRCFNYHIYPKDLKLYTDKGFVFTDNGEQGGTHCTCFYIKASKSFYF